MIPFAIPLALKTLPWRWIGIGAGVIAVLLALWGVYSHVWHKGYDKANAEWTERQRAAEAKAAADTKLLNDAIAEIDQSITVDMEAINAIRTVYRDRVRTIAVDRYRDRDCALPDGLRAQINAAAGDYAATARTGNAAVPTAKPAP
jgi:flagellar biosynthesis regulator FlaF